MVWHQKFHCCFLHLLQRLVVQQNCNKNDKGNGCSWHSISIAKPKFELQSYLALKPEGFFSFSRSTFCKNDRCACFLENSTLRTFFCFYGGCAMTVTLQCYFFFVLQILQLSSSPQCPRNCKCPKLAENDIAR